MEGKPGDRLTATVTATTLRHRHRHRHRHLAPVRTNARGPPSMAQALDPELEQQYRRLVADLPPLTDEQLDAVCDVLAAIRLRVATQAAS